ncbi:MAG: multidrug resistance efflux transporter family protein [Moraxella sp.]|nr:multidrug resistance efflux transporter family protein [Moraxella sp.]
MLRLVLLGLLAGLFFSSTFVLNELMASQGGHWFWSASGRYLFAWLILSSIILIKGGMSEFVALVRLLHSYWRFWVLAGGIGFGGFYSLLCFGADHAPGWLIATAFQFTSVASLIILTAFGEKLGKQVITTSLLIFTGTLVASFGEGVLDNGTSLAQVLLLGGLPALIAGFCLPIGNQLVWYATAKPNGDNALLRTMPHISSALMGSALNKVWLLTTGSLPFWLVLGIITAPTAPSTMQMFHTFLVALLSGMIATCIFIFARSKASTGGQIAAIDATQASEMIFAIIGGMVLLGSPLPSAVSLIGVLMVMAGLICFASMQS